MQIRLTDDEIQALIQEPKPLPPDFQRRLTLFERRASDERDLDLEGVDGSKFRLILRKSRVQPLDFSVILGVTLPGSTHLFRLRRYNAKSHEHTNVIEGNRIYGYHIHTATARYQARGLGEDGYAEQTDRFSSYNAAVRCLIEDCALLLPESDQLGLFE